MTIYLVPKLSKYELDRQRKGLSHDELIEEYLREGIDYQKMLSSHERQLRSLDLVARHLPRENILTRKELAWKKLDEKDFVVSLGGDNHFQFVSHYAHDAAVVGINSDPERSEGALTYFTAEEFSDLLPLEKNDLEYWTRLDAALNGRPISFAVSEYFLGELNRMDMSRYLIEFAGEKSEQKSSGLLVATGAGSTGWYHSAGGQPFAKDAGFAGFLATERYTGRLSYSSLEKGIMRQGEELVITSMNDSNGVVSADSIEREKFPPGSVAVITVAKSPLRVVAKH